MCCSPVLIMVGLDYPSSLKYSVVHRQRPLGTALGAGEAAIGSTEENQRFVDGVGGEPNHPTDEDDMIATIVVRIGDTFEMRDRTGNKRRGFESESMFDRCPFVAQCPGEFIRQMFLIPSQYVHRIAFGLDHGIETERTAVDREQNQRRIYRDRVERTHGQAHRSPIRSFRCDNGDPRCELTECPSEGPRIYIRSDVHLHLRSRLISFITKLY